MALSSDLATPKATQIADIAQSAFNAVQWNLSGAEVETESFARIEAARPPELSEAHWRVVRRLIHTTGDVDIAPLVRLSGLEPTTLPVVAGTEPGSDPVLAGRAALARKAPIFCDSNMIRSGLSVPKLRQFHPDYSPDDLFCHIADADVIARAKETGHTRALCAAEKFRPRLNGSIVLVGNAPLALARICRYILEENARPALILGIPVGFVNVEEAKALLPFCAVPYITVQGRRGGSPLAVAALHAIMEEV